MDDGSRSHDHWNIFGTYESVVRKTHTAHDFSMTRPSNCKVVFTVNILKTTKPKFNSYRLRSRRQTQQSSSDTALKTTLKFYFVPSWLSGKRGPERNEEWALATLAFWSSRKRACSLMAVLIGWPACPRLRSYFHEGLRPKT